MGIYVFIKINVFTLKHLWTGTPELPRCAVTSFTRHFTHPTKFSPKALLKVNLGKMRFPQAASLFSPPSQQVQPHPFKTFLKSQQHKTHSERKENTETNRIEILHGNPVQGWIWSGRSFPTSVIVGSFYGIGKNQRRTMMVKGIPANPGNISWHCRWICTLNTVLGSSLRFTRVTTRPEFSSTSKMLAL